MKVNCCNVMCRYNSAKITDETGICISEQDIILVESKPCYECGTDTEELTCKNYTTKYESWYKND